MADAEVILIKIYNSGRNSVIVKPLPSSQKGFLFPPPPPKQQCGSVVAKNLDRPSKIPSFTS